MLTNMKTNTADGAKLLEIISVNVTVCSSDWWGGTL